MNRRIVLSILFPALAIIGIALTLVHGVDISTRRQALNASCRLFVQLVDQGIDARQLQLYAARESLAFVFLAEGEEVPDNFHGMPTAQEEYNGGKIVLIDQQEPLLVSSRGVVLRWVLGGLAVVAMFFAGILSHMLSRPITELTAASVEITAGSYDRRVRVRSHGEMGRLEYQFNTMAAQLQSTIQQLDHRSAEMESIIATMRNGLIAVDEQMHVIRLNPIARALFEVHGNPYGQYVLDVTRNVKLESHLAAAMEQGEMYTAELPIRLDKENRVLRLYITGLVRENQSIGALALIEDITELKRLENVRVDFVANVTHELKTPLTSIRGFIETLQQGAIDNREAALRFLGIMSVEAERLTHLIDDILSLSSLEAGRRRETLGVIPLASFAEQICELLGPTAQEKNIRISIENNSGEALVSATADKLKQLLINLIDNAIKYTPEDGSVLVKTDICGDDVALCIRDTGIGIEPEHIPRLFERFYRVDKGRSRSMGGTGLGLAIVKHIVLELGGRIDVSSVYGKGSKFIVYLPAAQRKERLDDAVF